MKQPKFFCLVYCLLLFFLPGYSTAQNSLTENDSAVGMSLFSKFDIVNLSADSNISIATQALNYFEKAENWKLAVRCYNRLSTCYYQKNDFDRAEKTAKMARDLAEEKLGKENISYVDALFNLTLYLDVRGFHEDAITQYQKIIESDKKLNTNKADVALSYQNIARSYISIGDYEEAIEALHEALGIRQSDTVEADNTGLGINQADIGAAYSDLADCYKLKNEKTKAITFFQKSLDALKRFDKNNEYVNQVRYNCYYKLSDIYLQLDQKDLAYQYVNLAIQIKNKYSVYDNCFSYSILGKLNLSEGKKEAAFTYFDKAIEAATNEADGFANFPQIAATYTEKGYAHLQFSEFDQALIAFQKGLQTVSLDFDNDDVKTSPSLDQMIQKLGALDLIAGKANAFVAKYKSTENQGTDLELAYQQYELATQLIQAIRQGYNTNASKHILARKANQIYEEAIEVCDLLFKNTGNISYQHQAFIFAESNKAITLLESVNEEMALNLSGLPDSLINLERSLSIKLNFEEKKLAEEKTKKKVTSETSVQEIEARRFALKEQYKKLISQIENDYPEYYRLKYTNSTATVKEVQERLLNKETAILEYFVGEEFVYSFLITKDDFKVEKIQKTASFDNQINTLRQTISIAPESKTFDSSFQSYIQKAHEFYSTMLQKQLANLSYKVKNLIIVPDDIIGFVPFDILLTEVANPENLDYSPDNLSYLMERFFVSYGYSGTLLLNKQKASGKKNGLGFIGFAPSFGHRKNVAERTCSDSDLYNLRCSVEELNGINKNFDGKTIEGAASTKKVFLEQVSDYDIIHLATHACISEENAMLNRIHFSDDYITMYDLYNLKLNADLVVLSACNTGSGKMVKGEGVMSLSRGFIPVRSLQYLDESVVCR